MFGMNFLKRKDMNEKKKEEKQLKKWWKEIKKRKDLTRNEKELLMLLLIHRNNGFKITDFRVGLEKYYYSLIKKSYIKDNDGSPKGISVKPKYIGNID